MTSKIFFFQEHLSLFVNPYRLLILYTCTFKFLVHLGAFFFFFFFQFYREIFFFFFFQFLFFFFSFFLLPVLQRNNQHIILFTFGASRVTQMIKNLHVIKPGFDPWIGKHIATHSSILAWRIPRREEPGGLQSIASHRVRHN